MAAWVSRPAKMLVIDRKTVDPLFLDLISKCTPHGHEKHIVRIVQNSVGETHKYEIIEGNILVTVGVGPETMFSCHMDIVGDVDKANAEADTVDTIHLMMPDDEKQRGILYGAKFTYNEKGKLMSWTPSTLGADDKVGCWIMLKMIEQKIPGLYVFHVGEERGGIGSSCLSTKYKDKFTNLKRAVAFDRAGYGDIIDYQRGGQCCSSEFVKALAIDLNQYLPKFEKFSEKGVTGSFTDTANYRTLIPECTNLSVGYFQQHGVMEHLDYIWMKNMLLPAILQVKWQELPVKRDHTKTYSSSYTPWVGSKYTPNAKRKSWKDADDTTPMWELPLWTPTQGYVLEAKEIVRERAIQEYITTSCHGYQQKTDLAKVIANLLEFNHLLVTEVKLQEEQIQLLTNRKKTGTIEDIHIHKKKEFLRQLLEATKDISLVGKENNRIFQAYRSGAVAMSNRLKGKLLPEHFSKKEMRKFNRAVFMLTYLLSLETVLPESTTELLNEIHQYITLHIAEEGFDQVAFRGLAKQSPQVGVPSLANVLH